MDDVRQLMGEPTQSVDTAQLAIPYPGDENAVQPVFTYKEEQWTIEIYFGKYCYYTSELPENLENRLCQVVLSPNKDISFEKVTFPSFFKVNTKKLPDGFWEEYKDDCGLIYIINYKDLADTKTELKHLGSIMYGISNAEIEKTKKKSPIKNGG